MTKELISTMPEKSGATATGPENRSPIFAAPRDEVRLYVVLIAPGSMFPLWWLPDKDFPNLVLLFLRNSAASITITEPSKFTQRDCFLVPVEPWIIPDGDGEWPRLTIPCCQFVEVFHRGEVPAPCCVPSQIIKGGFFGFLATIESMWPDACRALCSVSDDTPPGWLPLDSIAVR